MPGAGPQVNYAGELNKAGLAKPGVPEEAGAARACEPAAGEAEEDRPGEAEEDPGTEARRAENQTGKRTVDETLEGAGEAEIPTVRGEKIRSDREEQRRF